MLCVDAHSGHRRLGLRLSSGGEWIRRRAGVPAAMADRTRRHPRGGRVGPAPQPPPEEAAHRLRSRGRAARARGVVGNSTWRAWDRRGHCSGRGRRTGHGRDAAGAASQGYLAGDLAGFQGAPRPRRGPAARPRWDPAAHALVGIQRHGGDPSAAALDLAWQPAGLDVPQAWPWRPSGRSSPTGVSRRPGGSPRDTRRRRAHHAQCRTAHGGHPIPASGDT
jgi:hypothetical protein